MSDREPLDRILSRIDSYRDAMIKMQYDLTAVPATSPDNGGDGEFRKAQLILKYLGAMNFPLLCKSMHRTAGRPRESGPISSLQYPAMIPEGPSGS